jgi:hypothetical protein
VSKGNKVESGMRKGRKEEAPYTKNVIVFENIRGELIYT